MPCVRAPDCHRFWFPWICLAWRRSKLCSDHSSTRPTLLCYKRLNLYRHGGKKDIVWICRAISTFLTKQADLKRTEAQTGAVTLIQRFGSAANLNIHLHCLFLDGVYRIDGDVPIFQLVRAPTTEQLQVLLTRIINRIMKLLTRRGHLIEEQGITYLAEIDSDLALAPLQSAACTYRIAFGPRAG